MRLQFDAFFAALEGGFALEALHADGAAGLMLRDLLVGLEVQ
jgi:hypothetical protein